MKLWLYVEMALILLVLVLVLEGLAHPIILAAGWILARCRAYVWRARFVDTQIRFMVDGLIKRDVQ